MSRAQVISKQIKPLYAKLRRMESLSPDKKKRMERIEAEIELIKIRGARELGIEYEPIV
jgi:hypothetical protein